MNLRKIRKIHAAIVLDVVPGLLILFCLLYFGYILIVNSAEDTSSITISGFILTSTLSGLSFAWAGNEFLVKKLKLNITMAGVRFLTAAILFLIITIFKYAYLELVETSMPALFKCVFEYFVIPLFAVAVLLIRWGLNRLMSSIVLYGRYNKRYERNL